MTTPNADRGDNAANTENASPLALAAGSACLVCGSKLTLQIRRGMLDLLHCNHCGSEVPRYIPQCDRQSARRPVHDPDHFLTQPMDNQEAVHNREIAALRAENEQLKIKLSRMCCDA